MTSRDAVRNSKAQSGALAFLGRPEVPLPKGLENYFELLGRDARPLIGHAEQGAIVLAREPDRYGALRRRHFDGVIDEIVQDLVNLTHVEQDIREFGCAL